MGYIHCCGGLRKCSTFILAPIKEFVLCELDVLKECPVCENFIIQLTRLDKHNKISVIRYSNKKAEIFYNKIKPKILYEEKFYNYSSQYSRFYLNYNEYGIKKRCYSNLSVLRIGKIG